MFATDRDLLVLEPNLFRDAAWIGQRLVGATGSLTDGVLSVPGINLAARGVEAGSVAMIDSLPVEVLEVIDTDEAEVSLVRADRDGAMTTPGDASDRPVVIATFRPQIAIVHAQILRMLGIEPDAPIPGEPVEADIVNPDGLRLVEMLGALHLIYSAASALSGPDSNLGRRAEMYRERFSFERSRAAAMIDLNGDGHPDAARRLNVSQFVRV